GCVPPYVPSISLSFSPFSEPVSCSVGYPQTHCVARTPLFMIFLPPLQNWDD
ncbi:hypothetical protein LEMLEM_LOCUS25787, partial [Lemmus lemmus]